MTPSFFSSGAVRLHQHPPPRPERWASFHRIEAKPSGDKMAYTAFSSIAPGGSGHSQRQRAAAVALPGDDGDDRHRQTAHLKEIPGDGLALTVFLSLQTGIGSGGVDKGKNRAAEASPPAS